MHRLVISACAGAFLALTSTAMVSVPLDSAHAQKVEKQKTGMSFNDRRKKCSAEWKQAKAAGQVSTMKWPKFWSDCNKRLKTQGA